MEEALAALNIKIERGVRAPIMESKGTPFTEAQEADRVYIYKSGIPNTGWFTTSNSIPYLWVDHIMIYVV